MNNTPDDWFQYFTTCPECGEKYHLSEVHECPGSEVEDEPEDVHVPVNALGGCEHYDPADMGGREEKMSEIGFKLVDGEPVCSKRDCPNMDMCDYCPKYEGVCIPGLRQQRDEAQMVVGYLAAELARATDHPDVMDLIDKARQVIRGTVAALKVKS